MSDLEARIADLEKWRESIMEVVPEQLAWDAYQAATVDMCRHFDLPLPQDEQLLRARFDKWWKCEDG